MIERCRDLITASYEVENLKSNFLELLTSTDSNLSTKDVVPAEILAEMPYLGPNFNAYAVINMLFYMVFGRAPFNKADEKDSLYKYVHAKRPDLFWKYHLRFCPQDHCSLAFREFIYPFLNYQSASSLAADAIKNSPWVISNEDFVSTVQDITKHYNHTMMSAYREPSCSRRVTRKD